MYKKLQSRLQSGSVLLLDGAIGTQLQSMYVPMNNTAWAAAALHTHPDTVRVMHRKYLQAGVDILTTNTYSSARHNLEPLGLGDQTWELNYRAVNLALEARDRFATDRDVAIAGSISSFGIIEGGEGSRSLHRHAYSRSEITERTARENLREQAECLADAGADFILLECTGSMSHRHWMMEECGNTGLPVWLGYRCRLDPGDPVPKIGYESSTSFEDGIKEFANSNIDGIAIFHSTVDATSAGIPIVKKHFAGPVAVYPESDRSDYTLPHRDESVTSDISPAEFPEVANGWIRQGVQVIGGCCGINLEYISGLKPKLDTKIPS